MINWKKLGKGFLRLGLLYENERYEAAISRTYYGMFNAAKALLNSEGSSPKTHAGVNSELGKLFRERIDVELLRDFPEFRKCGKMPTMDLQQILLENKYKK